MFARSKCFIERVRLRRLAWGDSAGLAAARRDAPGGYDVVFGADVVYVAEAVPALFASISTLLAKSPSARALLCHITRSASQPLGSPRIFGGFALGFSLGFFKVERGGGGGEKGGIAQMWL